MSRTLLLIGTALTAVSGCVTVQGPSAPPSPEPSRTVPPSSPDAVPHTVTRQGSVPERDTDRPRRERATPTPAGNGPAATPRGGPESGARRAPGTGTAPGAATGDRGAPPAPERRPGPPRAKSGEGRRPAHRDAPADGTGGSGRRNAPGAGANLCELGRTYGHWRPGSKEERICRETYGG